MAIEGPDRVGAPSLTSLPRFEDLPATGDGLDPERVREAFDAFRRHASQLQAQLRVIQAAGRGASVEPTGHAVRMDALHLIRAAAEFADTIERDAQNASASQLGKSEEEVRHRQEDLQGREAEVERYRLESERQRAEVEQTLEWARAQGSTILARAQHGAEQLLAAAGLGQEAIGQVASAIVEAAERTAEQSGPPAPASAFAGPSAVPQAAPPPPPVSLPPVQDAGTAPEPQS